MTPCSLVNGDSTFPEDEAVFFSKTGNNLPDLTVSLPLDHNIQYTETF
jgi:hypothetical protein